MESGKITSLYTCARKKDSMNSSDYPVESFNYVAWTVYWKV